MSDFSTSSELQVSVSQRSLSRARSTIRQELGGVTVDVNASTAGSSITDAVVQCVNEPVATSEQAR